MNLTECISAKVWSSYSNMPSQNTALYQVQLNDMLFMDIYTEQQLKGN